MEKKCKFCGKKLTGRSNYCNLREKRLYFYYTNQKGLSDEEIVKQSQSILELADVKGKPYKAERMDAVTLPLSTDLKKILIDRFGKKTAEFLRNELSAYLCLSEDRKVYKKNNTPKLDKTYTLLLPTPTKEYLTLIADRNVRSVTKELSVFIYILNEKIEEHKN